jgi:hypothetical protein
LGKLPLVHAVRLLRWNGSRNILLCVRDRAHVTVCVRMCVCV